MTGLMDMLTQQLGGSPMKHMSQHIGADEHATQRALTAALPAILGGLAKNASAPDGAQALHAALERDHDGSVLDDVMGAVAKPNTQAGEGILRHVLGGKRSAVEAGVSQASGLNATQATALMTMVAPMVMGALGKQKREQGLDIGALTGLLAGERQSLSQRPGVGGLLGMLDSDGDGQIADDLLKKGSGLLGGLLGRR